jgi:hypothetical protein
MICESASRWPDSTAAARSTSSNTALSIRSPMNTPRSRRIAATIEVPLRGSPATINVVSPAG